MQESNSVNSKSPNEKFRDLIYPNDDALINEFTLFLSMMTDEVFNAIRRQCRQEGKPFINPEYYFLFLLGMERLRKTNSDYVFKQLTRAIDRGDLLLPTAIARNLKIEYEDKIHSLRKVALRRKEERSLPEINVNDLIQAEIIVARILSDRAVNELVPQQVAELVHSKTLLRELVDKAHFEALPMIEIVAKPVIVAGDHVLDLSFSKLGITRTILTFSSFIKQPKQAILH